MMLCKQGGAAELPKEPFLARWRGRLVTGMLAVLVAVLAISNVLTLLRDDVHQAGYRTIYVVLRVMLGEDALFRVLSRSPVIVAEDTLKKRTEELTREAKRLKQEVKLKEKEMLDQASRHHSWARQRSQAVSHASKSLAARLSTRVVTSAATAGGKIIPVAGAGLVVAGVAWDVYDACETLKMINELNQEFGLDVQPADRVCGFPIPTQSQLLSKVKDNWKQAHRSAADALLNSGGPTITISPPQLGLQNVKDWVCPVVGRADSLC
jgi:hypothetical protein